MYTCMHIAEVVWLDWLVLRSLPLFLDFRNRMFRSYVKIVSGALVISADNKYLSNVSKCLVKI